MIDIKTLMHGNWYERVTVDGPDFLKYDVNDHINFKVNRNMERCFGIDLTEGALLRAGFLPSFTKPDVFTYPLNQNRNITVDICKNLVTTETLYKTDLYLSDIHFLHEVQNIVRMLSGKELDVKI